VLSAPGSGTATVMAANRWDSDAKVVLRIALGGRRIRLPSRGRLSLPAGTAMLMPIGYELGKGVSIPSAAAQLTGAQLGKRSVTLDLWAPAGGEVTVKLPAAPASVKLDGKPVGAERVRPRVVRIAIPTGDHQLVLVWRQPRTRNLPG